jgi:DNA invertase Pin-like site-specific DNA recombinase
VQERCINDPLRDLVLAKVAVDIEVLTSLEKDTLYETEQFGEMRDIRSGFDHDQSLENQLAELRDFAARCGWEIRHVYTDEASAKNGDRPGFKSMMESVARRQFDVLLFWALDRLTREGLRKTIHYLQRLDDAGVTFRSFTEQYLDTCGIFRDVVIGLMATLAQQERLRISERTKAGLARVRSHGKKLGRPRLKDLSKASRTTMWRRKKKQKPVYQQAIRSSGLFAANNSKAPSSTSPRSYEHLERGLDAWRELYF